MILPELGRRHAHQADAATPPPDPGLMLAEFKALRDEIANAQGRGWQAMGAAIAVLPAGQFVASTYKITVLTLALPLLVMVVGLMYVSQNLSVHRIGAYIREKLEPPSNGALGWESWLEDGAHERQRSVRYVETMLWFSFFLLFFLYYASSVYLAVRRAGEQMGVEAATGLLAGYVSIGIKG